VTPPHLAPRILVVDDDAAIRTLVVRVLTRAGFQALQAEDGAEAIECLDESRFDALVLDLMMPRVDGFAVVEHLIQKRPLMVEKTIVLTAFPKAAARQRLHHLCSVLSKPFDLSELVSMVETCVAR
jgi:two-component system OmpR family response regulator